MFVQFYGSPRDIVPLGFYLDVSDSPSTSLLLLLLLLGSALGSAELIKRIVNESQLKIVEGFELYR